MSKKGSMLSCELCKNQATMFCESDDASLCFDCDEKVHAANFLVAKHCRTLLCHVCGSHTPWKAAGLRLGPTVSVCNKCHDGEKLGAPASIPTDCASQESESDDHGEFDSDDDDDDDSEEDEDEEEEEGDNQVVPWSNAAVCSTAAAEEEGVSDSSLKRMRNDPLMSEDEDGCCSSQNQDSKSFEASDQLSFQLDSQEPCGSSSSASSLFRPFKMRRTINHGSSILPCSVVQTEGKTATTTIVDKLRRFRHDVVTEEGDTSAVVLGICKLSRDSSNV